MKVKITSTSSVKPSRMISNSYFEEFLDTNDEWIKTRTGIESRYFCNEHETSLQLAKKAVDKLDADLTDIDAIVVASMSSVELTPTISSQLVKYISENESIYAVDLNTGCSGFIYAFIHAATLIESNLFSKVLVVCTEQMSKILDFTDRGSCILFGDGAGALVLEKSNYDQLTNIKFKSRSNNSDLYTEENILKMKGQNVFKFAVREVSKIINETIDDLNVNSEYFDYIFLHQANIRIIEGVSKRTKIQLDKFKHNLEQYGNTSSASILILLDEYFKELKNNEKTLFCGFGAGLSWASFVYEHMEEK